ncbi:hypothetical protein TNCV_942331 [Trichonephila clavipes]|nr:hypothetical protein TNCV_942331 [Trichonephila clavipes]
MQRINGQATLSEWTKTAPLTKSSISNQLAQEERADQSLDGLMAQKKIFMVFSTKNWRKLAGRRLAWKRLLEKAKAHPGLSSHRERKESFYNLIAI